MPRSLTTLALLTMATVFSPVHHAVAQGVTEPAPEQPAPQQAVTGELTMSGRLVLPEDLPQNVKKDAFDFSQTKATWQWEVPTVPLPTPAGYDEMTQQEQRAWARQFHRERGPAFLEYSKKAREQWEEQKKQPFVAIELAEDGRFSISGIKPGTYRITVSMPHPRAPHLPLLEMRSRVEAVAGQAQTDLGDLAVTVYNVLLPGDMAPDFTAKAYDGGTFKLSDYRGKYVLIDFWATWCKPCIAEMPNLKAVYKDYAGDNFEMIALSMDATIDLPIAFEKKNPSDYVHGFLNATKDPIVPKQYGVRGIPSIWLIGPDGKIVARDLRGEKLRDAVKAALAPKKVEAS